MKNIIQRIKDLRFNKFNIFLKLFFNSNTVGKLTVNNPTALNFQKNSKIQIAKNAQFLLNKKWSKNDYFPSLLFLGENAKIFINGTFSIYSGSRIYVNKNAELILGSGFINNNLNLSCFNKIEIGNQVAISENVSIRDSDNHQILNSTNEISLPIKIGNKVWIGMNVTILKGVEIGDGAIIAAGSVVTRNIASKCLAAGVPAKIIKTNVEWQ